MQPVHNIQVTLKRSGITPNILWTMWSSHRRMHDWEDLTDICSKLTVSTQHFLPHYIALWTCLQNNCTAYPNATCHPTDRPAAHLHLLRASFLHHCSSAMTRSLQRTENLHGIPCELHRSHLLGRGKHMLRTTLQTPQTASSLKHLHAHLWLLPGSISCLGAPQLQLKWLRRWRQAENGNTCPQEPPVSLPQICTESSLEAKTGLPSALYLCRQLLAKTLSFS